MNTSDSQRAQKILEQIGYTQTQQVQDADLVLVLACSIRQTAVDRVFGKSSLFQKIRKKKEITTVLSGCVIDQDKPKLSEFFDIILSSAELPQLPNRLNIKQREDMHIEDYLDITPKYSSTFSVFVPIMNGCNKFCTYCVVPYTRGREVSRNYEHILNEVRHLIEKGCKEIILLGQNVNSYRDMKSKIDFPTLLHDIDQIEGDYWLRFTTSHPYDMSNRLIEVIKQGKHIANQLHLPVQSGNNEVLKRMNRHYTVEHYKSRIEKVREAMPKISLTTDIIVGFCSETKEQFEDTLALFEELRFDMAYISQYSPRKGTKAYTLFEDDVKKTEKIRREKVLDQLLRGYAKEYNEKMYKDKSVKVLVDKVSENGMCFGKTQEQKHIKFEGKTNMLGTFVSVTPIEIDSFKMYGHCTQNGSDKR